MEQKHVFDLLENAKEEIKALRAENKVMGARLEMFDSLMSVFNAQKAQKAYGMAPDIVYEIDKTIAETKYKDRHHSQINTSDNAFKEGSLGIPDPDKK